MEDFWALYNNITTVDRLESCNLHLFLVRCEHPQGGHGERLTRERRPFTHARARLVFPPLQKGITPMWEDEQNKKGGKWVCQLPSGAAGKTPDYWLKTVWEGGRNGG